MSDPIQIEYVAFPHELDCSMVRLEMRMKGKKPLVVEANALGRYCFAIAGYLGVPYFEAERCLLEIHVQFPEPTIHAWESAMRTISYLEKHLEQNKAPVAT